MKSLFDHGTAHARHVGLMSLWVFLVGALTSLVHGSDGADEARILIGMDAPFVATNPVMRVTWQNVGTNTLVWYNASTNISETWGYRFLDLYVDGEKCPLRQPELDSLDIEFVGQIDIPAGTAAAFCMSVRKRWCIPEDWTRLSVRCVPLRAAATVPMGRDRTRSPIVNKDEVFTFDREGNRVQDTDTDP